MQGADAIEADLQLTKDGQIVCIHDENTERTTRKRLAVASSTLEALRELNAGSWFGTQYAGQRIPTLDEILAAVPEGRRVFLDLKSGVEILQPLGQALAASKMTPDQIVLLSANREVVAEAARLLPAYKRLLVAQRRRKLNSEPFTPSAEDLIASASAANATGISLGAPGLLHDHEAAKKILASGHELHVWTVNQGKNAKVLRKLGVHSVTTDRPGWLRSRI